MFDEELTAVFRDSNSHCALRINEKDGVVHFIAITEKDGSVVVDLFKESARNFHHEYKELVDYPINKAAAHYLHPITAAIRVTDAAERQLKSILKIKEHRTMSTNSVNVAHTAKAASNVAATHKGSVKTSTKAAHAPAVADVKGKDPTKAQKEAAKKKVAADAATKKADAAKAAKDAKEEAAAKANAAKGKAPPAAIKKAKAAKKADAKRKPTPAKKVAKLVRNPKHTPPPAAKKAAKKGKAEPAKKVEYDEGKAIIMVTKDNPRRADTSPYEIFELLKKSKTVGDFYKKGGAAVNLRRNLAEGHIKLK